MWTPWEPVDAEIDGDHIVAAMWRGRLHIFWVTFIEKITGNNTQATGTSSSTTLKDWGVNDALATVTSGAKNKTIEAHLHWSEFYQGQWSTKKSAGPDNPISNTVPYYTNINSISITIAKETNITEQVEGALRISLSGLGGFRVVNKNSPPEIISADSEPDWMFTSGSYFINRIKLDRNNLAVSYPHLIKTLNGETQNIDSNPQIILGKTKGQFNLVPCTAAVTMGGVEFGPLITPFFYQDSWNTFYIEPSLTETITINEWDEWVGGPAVVYQPPKVDWGNIVLEPYHPWPINVPVPRNPGDPGWIDTENPLIKVAPLVSQDWATNPNTYIKFDERVVGKDAGMNVLLTNNGSQSPQLVKGADQLNHVIHNQNDAQGIVLVPAEKANTLSNKTLLESKGLNENITAKTGAVLVGGAGITPTRTVGISQSPGGIFAKNLPVTKSLNNFLK
jgi:hypothetical protein